MAVLSRAVGDHEVGPWRSRDKSEDPAQILPTALHAVSVQSKTSESLEQSTCSRFTHGETEARES